MSAKSVVKETRPVFFLELRASDMYSALGRLLDQARVADLKLAAVSARAEEGACRILASIEAGDRERVEKLARRVGAIVGVAAIDVRSECACTAP